MDPIANLLTSLRNGYRQQKEQIILPASNLSWRLCRLLKDYGYISDCQNNSENKLEINLKYRRGIPAINSVKRISKPSRRYYSRAKNIPRPSHGKGIILLTTPQGIMTHIEARKKNLGGEIICEVA